MDANPTDLGGVWHRLQYSLASLVYQFVTRELSNEVRVHVAAALFAAAICASVLMRAMQAAVRGFKRHGISVGYLTYKISSMIVP